MRQVRPESLIGRDVTTATATSASLTECADDSMRFPFSCIALGAREAV